MCIMIQHDTPEAREERTLLQILLDADALIREQGDQAGLCDRLDADGPYQSEQLSTLLWQYRQTGARPAHHSSGVAPAEERLPVTFICGTGV